MNYMGKDEDEFELLFAGNKFEKNSKTRTDQFTFLINNSKYSLVHINQADINESVTIYNQVGGAIYYSDSDGSYDNILSERETNAMKKFINSTPNFSPKLTDRLTEVLKNDAVELKPISYDDKGINDSSFFKFGDYTLGVNKIQDVTGKNMGIHILKFEKNGMDSSGGKITPIFETDKNGEIVRCSLSNEEKEAIFKSKDSFFDEAKEALIKVEPITLFEKKTGNKVIEGSGQEVVDYIIKQGKGIAYKKELLKDDRDKGGIDLVKESFKKLSFDPSTKEYRVSKGSGKELSVSGENGGKFVLSSIGALYEKMSYNSKEFGTHDRSLNSQLKHNSVSKIDGKERG